MEAQSLTLTDGPKAGLDVQSHGSAGFGTFLWFTDKTGGVGPHHRYVLTEGSYVFDRSFDEWPEELWQKDRATK